MSEYKTGDAVKHKGSGAQMVVVGTEHGRESAPLVTCEYQLADGTFVQRDFIPEALCAR
jgi:uncharacterized protein YodC (DUF2158 family)